RAVLEGVCFALRDSLTILQELGLAPGHLLLTGGGAKSAFIRQLQADVFGLPVTTVNREEGGAYGAALLAAVGAGAFPDLKTAAQRTLTRQALTPPNPETHSTYESIYGRVRSRLASRPPGTITSASAWRRSSRTTRGRSITSTCAVAHASAIRDSPSGRRTSICSAIRAGAAARRHTAKTRSSQAASPCSSSVGCRAMTRNT